MKHLVASLFLTLGVAFNSHAVENTSKKEIITVEVNYNIELNTFCKLIQKGNIEAVKNLIAQGTNINKKSLGLTPLMYAARYNKVEIIELLIAKGVKLKTKSDSGFTALDYAKLSKANDAYQIIFKAINS